MLGNRIIKTQTVPLQYHQSESMTIIEGRQFSDGLSIIFIFLLIALQDCSDPLLFERDLQMAATRQKSLVIQL